MSRGELRSREDVWTAAVTSAQSGWHTPGPLLDDIVSRVAGERPSACDRLHAGTSNEAYVCDVAVGRLVVRVARLGVPHFAQERWAIGACRARGVPAPEVLLVAHEEADGELLSFCVERYLPGIPLGKLARRRGRDDALVATALHHAGEILAAIHSVPTRSFGPIDGSGSARLPDWPAFLDERLGALPPEPPPEVTRALEVLEAYRADLAEAPARLLHFDFEPSHLLVDDSSGKVTGVLDFENAKSGDPAYDFAQWDAIHDAYAPVEPLFRGYAESVTLPADFGRRRLLSEIHFRVRELVQGMVPPAFVAAARARLERAVTAFA